MGEPKDDAGSGSEDDARSPAENAGELDEFATFLSGAGEPSLEAANEAPDSDQEVARQIGNYKLLQKIGEGGMGTVWMAEQERPVRRRVALKLVKGELASKEIIARFEAERQALAMMEHQNIAKILDAGTTEQGSPYFVMELVNGVPITKYCDTQNLSVSVRLELFSSVCRAIQHAHQKGIIHRDLKPSNVLVTVSDGQPVPKVIDFGLAKAIDHQTKLSDQTVFTEFGQVVGTLQYMSPEQAGVDALDIDTRTDIYSLGVILYELLTGSTPLEREAVGSNVLFKVLEMIREQEPPRPSDRLSSSGEHVTKISERREIAPARLQQVLKGELDWVVMKALDKDRTRRYATANDFAEDVQRYLKDEAVLAKPPSFSYQARKFVRKNRGLVSAVSTIALLLVAAVAVSAWFAIDASRQRDVADRKSERAIRAEVASNQSLELARQRSIELEKSTKEAVAERTRAEQEKNVALEVRKFLQDSLLRNASSWERANSRSDKSVPLSGNNVTIGELLDIASEKFSPDRIANVFPDRPKVQAEILATLADSYESLEQLDRALELSIAASRILESNFGKSSPEFVESKIVLYFSGLRNFKYQLATGSLVEAMDVCLNAYTLVEQLEAEGQPKDVIEGQLKIADRLYDAMIDRSLDRLDPSRYALPVLDTELTSPGIMINTVMAVNQFKSLAQKLEQRYGKEHDRSRYSRLGITFCDYAVGAASGSDDLMQQAVLEFERLFSWTKTWPEEQALSRCMLELSLAMMLKSTQMKPELALTLFEDSHADIDQRLSGDHPATIIYSVALADALDERDRMDEALDLYLKLTPNYMLQLGGELRLLSVVTGLAKDTNRRDEALEMLDECCESARQVYGTDKRSLMIWFLRAAADVRFGNTEEAIKKFDSLMDEVVGAFGEADEETFHLSCQCARELYDAGRSDEAEEILMRFEVARKESRLGLGNRWIRLTNRLLARIYFHSQRHPQAVERFLKAIEGMKTDGSDPGALQDEQLGLSKAYMAMEQFPEAISILKPVVRQTAGGLLAKRSPTHHRYQELLATAYYKNGDHAKAIELQAKMVGYARGRVRRSDPNGPSLLSEYLLQLANSHFQAKDYPAAIVAASESLEIQQSFANVSPELVLCKIRLATFLLSQDDPPFGKIEPLLDSAHGQLLEHLDVWDRAQSNLLLVNSYQQRLRFYEDSGDSQLASELKEEMQLKGIAVEGDCS